MSLILPQSEEMEAPSIKLNTPNEILPPALDDYDGEPTGYNVLLRVYLPKEYGIFEYDGKNELRKRSCPSLVLNDKIKELLLYEQVVGQVVAIGPDAYKRDAENSFPSGAWCKPGDYVLFVRSRTDSFLYKGHTFKLIPDTGIKKIVKTPDEYDLDGTWANQVRI